MDSPRTQQISNSDLVNTSPDVYSNQCAIKELQNIHSEISEELKSLEINFTSLSSSVEEKEVNIDTRLTVIEETLISMNKRLNEIESLDPRVTFGQTETTVYDTPLAQETSSGSEHSQENINNTNPFVNVQKRLLEHLKTGLVNIDVRDYEERHYELMRIILSAN